MQQDSPANMHIKCAIDHGRRSDLVQYCRVPLFGLLYLIVILIKTIVYLVGMHFAKNK
jgi:hypothetical protein